MNRERKGTVTQSFGRPKKLVAYAQAAVKRRQQGAGEVFALMLPTGHNKKPARRALTHLLAGGGAKGNLKIGRGKAMTTPYATGKTGREGN